MNPCEQVQTIAESPEAKSILLAKSFLSMCAAAFTLYLVFKKGIKWITHPNARILYSLHIFWVFSISAMNICVFCFDFVRLSRPVSNPCDRLLTIGFCMGTKMITILAIVAQETSMLAFALERAYATIKPGTYEQCNSSTLGIVLGVLSILLAAGCKYGLMLPGLNFSTLTATYDVIFPGNGYLFQISLYAEMVIEFSTGVIFVITYLWNYLLKRRAISDVAGVLGTKYQVYENKQLIILLFPCFILHFFLNLLVVVLLAMYPWFYQEDYLKRFIWTEVCSQPFIYGMFLPLMVIYRLNKMDKKKAKAPKGFSMNTEEHFNELRRVFNGPPPLKYIKQ